MPSSAALRKAVRPERQAARTPEAGEPVVPVRGVAVEAGCLLGDPRRVVLEAKVVLPDGAHRKADGRFQRLLLAAEHNGVGMAPEAAVEADLPPEAADCAQHIEEVRPNPRVTDLFLWGIWVNRGGGPAAGAGRRRKTSSARNSAPRCGRPPRARVPSWSATGGRPRAYLRGSAAALRSAAADMRIFPAADFSAAALAKLFRTAVRLLPVTLSISWERARANFFPPGQLASQRRRALFRRLSVL